MALCIRRAPSILIRGRPNNPIELADKAPSLSNDEIDVLLEEVSEIENLLFFRLLLSYASLSPAAIRANSVEEFMKMQMSRMLTQETCA